MSLRYKRWRFLKKTRKTYRFGLLSKNTYRFNETSNISNRFCKSILLKNTYNFINKPVIGFLENIENLHRLSFLNKTFLKKFYLKKIKTTFFFKKKLRNTVLKKKYYKVKKLTQDIYGMLKITNYKKLKNKYKQLKVKKKKKFIKVLRLKKKLNENLFLYKNLRKFKIQKSNNQLKENMNLELQSKLYKKLFNSFGKLRKKLPKKIKNIY